MEYIVVSFSGGKDSTAMLLHMIELGEHIDEVVCCDTYKEFPAMYQHINKIKKVVEDNNIKFTMLKSEKSFDYYMFEYMPQRKNEKYKDVKGYSWPWSRNRWCTSKLKVDIINRYFKQLRQTYNVIQCIGLSYDEQYRLERESNKKENLRHPLVEWKWTEEDCLEYCYSKGFDWGGLYSIFKRVSCWCCPLQSLSELRKLYELFPELWLELKDMDDKAWYQFRADYSVKDLEVRFELEKEYEKNGKSTRSKEFFKGFDSLRKNGECRC